MSASRSRVAGPIRAGVLQLTLVVLLPACEQPPVLDILTRSSPGRLWNQELHLPFSLPAPDPAREAVAASTRGRVANTIHGEVSWLLTGGRTTRALNLLLAEAANNEPSPRLGTDISAAYLARAAQTAVLGEANAGRAALDLLDAAKWARQAVELDPAAPQPRFNYATALTRLALTRAGQVQWRAYHELDPASGWAGEGYHFAQSLKRQTVSRDGSRALANLSPDPEPEAIRELVRDFGYESRVHVEKVILPSWPTEGPAIDLETSASHVLGRRIAEALAAQRGEHLLADAIAFLDSGHGTARADLILAHQRYAEGLEDFENRRFASAQQRLLAACQAMDALGTPFKHACKVQYAIALNPDDSRAAQILFRELEAAVPDRYPTVRGRVHWMLGIAGLRRERWPDVLDHFAQAARDLERGAGTWRAAGAHALLGEAFERYGDSDAGWRHNLKALQATAGHPDHRRRQGTLFGMIDALVRTGRAEQAIPICDEMVLNAEAWGDDGALAEAYSRRAWAWMEIGDEAASRADIAVALAAADKLPPTRLAHRSSRFVESLIRTRFGPWSDPEALAAAHRHYARDRLAYERLPFLLARARALELAGDLEASSEALLEAVELHEARGGAFQPTGMRLLARSLAEDVYRRLVRQAVALDRPARALLLADRSRWFDRRPTDAPGNRPAESSTRPDEFVTLRMAPFDAGTFLVDYTVLDEETVALVVEKGSGPAATTVRAVRIGAGKKTIARLVERLSRALASGDPASRQTAIEAHRLLIAPLALGENLGRLIVVADRALWRLSFGALIDADGRHLIERTAVSLALSLRQASAAASRRQQLELGSPPPAVIAGDVDLSGTRWHDRAPLPAAASEIEAISALYADAVVLSGRAVHKEGLLAALEGSRVFHFAGHADVDAERREGARLLLARSPAGSPSSDALSSWDLIDDDWSGLELAFLSACRTLDGYQVGREGLVGLGSAFVAGGALAAVVSRWDIEDDMARRFAVRFHQAYRGTRDPAYALRQVALADLAAGEPSLFWASFAVLGT